ncbi:putative transcriptional regulator, Crp/Fnr family [Gloeothece citriformis PCC 7424]|uniref:Putative transcriptional regulator, Crp/Fnr family n=1 Tax=Gloeothece citriformis (strain PCC 7424) TaxID=65393 RepID=B7KKL1_GLOC7|nr:Crp/Fnr family transcriptional regulator [Gloeothece citriformis]ACK72344.1 putative transcriptional regulator, Crp/Fnr family [Gloeothece citriformis PCC 7424]
MLLTENANPTLAKDQLSDGRRLHYYDKGENIPLAEEGVWQVYRGIAQISQICVSGEEILLGWAQPFTFFGLWLTHVESYQVKALTDLYLRWYSFSEIENTPQLSQVMLTQLARRMRQTEALLAIAGLKRVEERLQQLLALLKQELGQPVSEGTRIGVRLTHQNLANAIGTTRVTVTRLLGDFQRQGLISVDGDRHIILK